MFQINHLFMVLDCFVKTMLCLLLLKICSNDQTEGAKGFVGGD